jgi:hypothetical protein
MPKNKTKKNGPANRLRRTGNPIVNRANRPTTRRNNRNNNNNNNSNNSNETVEYNVNNNNILRPPRILTSAIRLPGQVGPRRTISAAPINMTTVKPRTVRGETYLFHKRTGNIYAPAFQTRVHTPRAVFNTESLNDGTSYNASRAFPVQIRQYDVSRGEYAAARKQLSSNIMTEYVKKNAQEIIYIQQWADVFIEKYNTILQDALTEDEIKELKKQVLAFIQSKHIDYRKGNVRTYNELTQEEKNIYEFQDNIFKEIVARINNTISKVYETKRDSAIATLQIIMFIYYVFNQEGVLNYLSDLPEYLDNIVFTKN